MPGDRGGAEDDTGEGDAAYDDGAVGVYVHLPFCERVCPYCDFAVLAARPLAAEVEDRYVAGVLAELAARRVDFPDRRLASVYLGGGTPSLFRPGSVARLLGAIREAFPEPADPPIEITLELNPSTVERARLPEFRAAGVTRLSVGVQSFDDAMLKRLGRAHRADAAHATLAAARAAGFDDLSLDLIFAGPGQTLDDLERDLDAVVAFGPEHVSSYELTWEPETPFGRALADGRMAACEEDLAIEMTARLEARLGAAGLERYEISSYARPGRRARHNARYWQRQAVLGLGLSAHSTEARSRRHPHGARRANPRALAAWQAGVEGDAPGKVGTLEPIDPATARGEAVFLALRQREGLSAARFAAEFGAPPRAFFAAGIDRARERGWLAESGEGDLRLTEAGRWLADSVAAEFVAEAGSTTAGAGTPN